MDGEDRIPVTARAAWGLPFVLAVGCGAAAVDQMVGGHEASWYVVWPALALVVAAGSLVLAGPYRIPLAALAPSLAVAPVTDGLEGVTRWALFPVWASGIVVFSVCLRRYRFW